MNATECPVCRRPRSLLGGCTCGRGARPPGPRPVSGRPIAGRRLVAMPLASVPGPVEALVRARPGRKLPERIRDAWAILAASWKLAGGLALTVVPVMAGLRHLALPAPLELGLQVATGLLPPTVLLVSLARQAAGARPDPGELCRFALDRTIPCLQLIGRILLEAVLAVVALRAVGRLCGPLALLMFPAGMVYGALCLLRWSFAPVVVAIGRDGDTDPLVVSRDVFDECPCQTVLGLVVQHALSIVLGLWLTVALCALSLVLPWSAGALLPIVPPILCVVTACIVSIHLYLQFVDTASWLAGEGTAAPGPAPARPSRSALPANVVPLRPA